MPEIDRDLVIASWRTVRANTIQVARDIPADKYDFSPAEGFSTVLELFQRLSRLTEFIVAMAFWPDATAPAEVRDRATRDQFIESVVTTKKETLTGKDAVIAALTSSIERFTEQLKAADPAFLSTTIVAADGAEKIRLWMVQNAKEQEMVIRGQLMLVERILGIVPHTTRRAQEAQQQK